MPEKSKPTKRLEISRSVGQIGSFLSIRWRVEETIVPKVYLLLWIYGSNRSRAWGQVSLSLRGPARNRKTRVDLQVD
jgi:hypothetical protein